jgi:MFS transporter, ACS family, D-galactonate transporter
VERTELSPAEWSLVLLLVISVFLNYVDRGNLSIAAPLLSTEFSLTPARLGSLLAAFFWTYALVQLFGVAGWAADRFPAGLVLAGGLFLWSATTAAAAFVTGFASLFTLRLLLGAGESVAYPCYSRLIAAGVRAHHRGKANALIDAGSKLGPGLGSLLGGLLLARTGWRIFFFVLGIASLLWLPAWLRWMPRSNAVTINAAQAGPSTKQILSTRSAWGAFFGHFCGNYFWYFLLTWLPTYLVSERKFSVESMAQVSSVAFFAIAGATVTAGWLSDRWIAAGGSPTRVRKAIVVGGLTFATIILPVAMVSDLNVSLTLLFLSCIGFGVYASNHWAITQTLAGPLAAGRWTSLQNGVGNLAGVAASWLTGQVVERTHSYPLAFVAAATFALAGAFLWGAVVGPVEQVHWPEPARL